MLTDFHSHILPGMDDGSKSVKESLAMLGLLGGQGVGSVVATPHFYPRYDGPDAFLSRRDAALAQLRSAMEGREDLPEIYTGAEVYYFPGMSESEVLHRMTMGQSPFVMVEMPMGSWTSQMYRELEEIYVKQKLVPVIAHVDRYIRPLASHGIPEQLAQLPVVVQANAEFFLRRSTARFALRLLREGKIHILGSDCHNLTDRAPKLGEAADVIRRRLGEDMMEQLRVRGEEILPAR